MWLAVEILVFCPVMITGNIFIIHHELYIWYYLNKMLYNKFKASLIRYIEKYISLMKIISVLLELHIYITLSPSFSIYFFRISFNEFSPLYSQILSFHLQK